MELDDNETAVHSDTINAQGLSSKVSELDLYDELTAFAELSPEEQAQLIERQQETLARASMTSAANSEEPPGQLADRTEPPSESVEPEATPSDTESPLATDVEHHASSKELATDLTFEPVQTEQRSFEAETPSTQEFEESPSLEQPSTY